MCTGSVKSPTPKTPDVKDPIYMRNPWLDGLGISGEARGRNSLRIDLGSPVPHPGVPSTPGPVPPPVVLPGGNGPAPRGPNDPTGIRNVARSSPATRRDNTTGGPLPPIQVTAPGMGGPAPVSRRTPGTGGPAPATRGAPRRTGGPAPISIRSPGTGGNAPRTRLGIGR